MADRFSWRRGANALAMTLLLSSGLARAVVVQDDGGMRVTVGQPVQRVVSLSPTLTELVCALGACARLVGVDRYSNWPERVQALPKLGGGIDPSIEAVVALQPDLVLMASSAVGADRLRALGLRVLRLEPKTHADMQRTLTALAQALGGSGRDATRLWTHWQSEVAQVAATLTPQQRGKSVYIEVSSAPHAASVSSFLGETLHRLGPRNIVGAQWGPFPLVNPEWVVRQQPDVILAADTDVAALLARPGWAALRAVQQQRVCGFSPQETDVLVRAGPRMGEAARLMARCFQDRP